MTRQMAELQAAVPARDPVAFVSLTTDPDFDTPPVLKAYAERYQADPARWRFLTGSKEQIARLAMEGLRLTALEQKPELRTAPEDLFIHSTVFVLVDRRGRLRGVFETGGPDVDWPQSRAALLAATARLLREP
jgi:protein SCO1/2